MNKKRLIVIVSTICVAVIAVVMLPMAQASSCHSDHEQKPKMGMKARSLSLETIHSGHLPMVSKSIEKAIKAVETDNKEAALAELHKAQKMLAAINAGIAKHVKPKFANAICPIMGSPINLDKVAKSLIRDYKDQKIAFCCGGCPGQWDKLTNAEKEAKLAKVTPKPMKNHSECKH